MGFEKSNPIQLPLVEASQWSISDECGNVGVASDSNRQGGLIPWEPGKVVSITRIESSAKTAVYSRGVTEPREKSRSLAGSTPGF